MWCEEHNVRINAMSGICEAEYPNLGYQHLRYTNDANGNPRRLFVIVSLVTGDMLDVIDEEYLGESAVDEAGYDRKQMKQLPSYDIAPGVYRRMLRDWQFAAQRRYNAKARANR